MCTRCSNQASPLHLQVHLIQAVNVSTDVDPGADASAADLVGAVSEDIKRTYASVLRACMDTQVELHEESIRVDDSC